MANNEIRIPVVDFEALRVNEPLYLLVGKYAESLQRKILNEGNYQQLLNEYIAEQYQRAAIQVEVPASKDRISYPELLITFDYFYTQKEGQYWGVIPVLGMESVASSHAELEKRLVRAAQLDFTRNHVLQNAQALIPMFWQEEVTIEKASMDLRFLTLKEIEDQSDQPDEQLLPRIAQKLAPKKQVAYARKNEIKQFLTILKSRFGRNVLVVGASGVGKTALIQEVARQYQKANQEGDIYETTASLLIKELTKDTGWQQNLALVCRELANKKDILFVRNFMELFEVGQYAGNSVSMAQFLRNYISRGEVTLISECTEEELARIELRTPNYISLFQIIRLTEPKENLEKIIVKKVNDLAAARHVRIDTESIQETLRLNRRFTPYAGFPGKPIRFLESVLLSQLAIKPLGTSQSVKKEDIIRYFCEDTGMPRFMIDPNIPFDSQQIRKQFNRQVFGQPHAVDGIVNLLASVKTALTRTGKPIGSLLFAGPTGVGKTELTKVLSEFMFGSRDRLIRFDMSEFSDPYSVMRLTGLSYQSDGLLTSAVRQMPFCVLLLDEVEKAHPDFFDLLLQILSEGRLTDSSGKVVNFCSSIIIMTSNIGAESRAGGRISFLQEENARPEEHFRSAVQQFFRPELYNRIDEIIPFVPLSQKVIRHVVQREINLFKKLEGIHFRRLNVTFAPAVYDFLAREGYQPEYGARQLQRVIREQLISPLAKQLNLYDNQDQLEVTIQLNNEQIEVLVKADPLGVELMLEELEQIGIADYAGTLRRQFDNLLDQKSYIKLLNSLQYLEQLKQRIKADFWKDKKRAKQYPALLDVKAKAVDLKEKIALLEREAVLGFMGIETFSLSINQQLEDWKVKENHFKNYLIESLHPELNTAFLTLYARNVRWLADIYLKIAEIAGFSTSLQAIWYRKDWYEDALDKAALPDPPPLYLESGFFTKIEMALQPKESGDLLCGVVIKVEGELCRLWFHQEEGVHVWSSEKGQFFPITVAAPLNPLPHPQELHRKISSRKFARRIYQPEQITDKIFKWEATVEKERFAEMLVSKLKEQFAINREPYLK